MSRSVGTTRAPTSPRRHLSVRQARTVQNLLDAASLELAENHYGGLSIRQVASRARVAPATAYTYFASREHLVTELFLQRLLSTEAREAPGSGPAAQRVADALSPLAELATAEPELASACTTAMLSNDPEVARVRATIGAHTASVIRGAVGGSAEPDQLRTLEAAWSGLLLQAGMGYIDYAELPALVRRAAAVIFGKEG